MKRLLVAAVLSASTVAACSGPLESLLPPVAPSPTDTDAGPIEFGYLAIDTEPPSLPFAVVTSYRPLSGDPDVSGQRVEAGAAVDIATDLTAGSYEVRANDMGCGVVKIDAGLTTKVTLALSGVSCAIQR